jgi:2-dehydro-3-deoxyphosphogluconate aldolase/(4S)-4-hydroxy-2-oxoglutarate aldolase
MTAAARAREAIEDSRLIAIVRAVDATTCQEVAESLVAERIGVLEISLAVPQAEEAITGARAHAGGRALIGAGTVVGLADAERALRAGAQFLISPNLDPAVVRWARERDVLHIPGVLTPTEVASAHAAGSTHLKVFPAGALGPQYISDLLGPYPDARLIPTGGVDAHNAANYLAAGAVAVAVATALTGGSLEQLPDRARRFLALTSQPPLQEPS